MKYNIGIFGIFDTEDYGDAFYPVVFIKAMEERNLDFNLYAFSPTVSENTRLIGADYNLYPISELENINRQYPLDAIIIGGGAIINYSRMQDALSEENSLYGNQMLESWVTPILFGLKNKIKILFYAAKVPVPFDEKLFGITKALLKQIEYMSVQDELSKEHILSMYGEHEKPVDVNVFPNSLCCLPQMISRKYLDDIRKNVLTFDSPYAVVQVNDQLSPKDILGLISAIRCHTLIGLEVVLLPQGNPNDIVLGQLSRENGGLCQIIGRDLTMYEMAALLAGCRLYIGNRFHSAITAAAYGNQAMVYDCNDLHYDKRMLEAFGIEEYVDSSMAHLSAAVQKLLATEAQSADVCGLTKLVNDHFDQLYKVITNASRSELVPFDCEAVLFSLLSDAVEAFDRNKSLQTQLQQNKETISMLENLRDNYQGLYESSNKSNLELTQRYNIVVHFYNSISASFWWRATKPARKLVELIKKGIKKIPLLKKPYMALVMIKNLGFQKAFVQMEIDKNTQNYRNPYPSKSVLMDQRNTEFDRQIKFSIVVPLYNTPRDFLKEMLASVVNQTYTNWELCMADGSDSQHAYVEEIVRKLQKKDSRIKYMRLPSNQGISENTNACIQMATGDYIGLFDHDDVLHPSVLFEYMRVICDKNADFIYCDEDKFESLNGKFFEPHFKPDFALENLRSNNYICHFTVFKKELLDQTGMLRKAFDGSQDHDLVLRLTEKAKHIVHVPKLLYHWRVSNASVASDPYAKPYTIKAGIHAVEEHLVRCGLKGSVESTEVHPNMYRIKYELINQPLVSIIIPNNNHVKDLSTCINSILAKTTYCNYEIIIVENNSDEETFAYYNTLKKYDNIKVVVYKAQGGFNYSAINNFGRLFAKGEQLILLNNDIEVITPGWIEELLMYSQRNDVGAVGAMLYYPNDTIQHAGVIVGILGVAAHLYRTYPKGIPGYCGRCAYQQNLSAVTAACLMIKSTIYDEINGLDEKFEVAFNDIDFCMRIREKGYFNVWTPFAELYHHESISRGLEDTLEKQERFKNEIERFRSRWKKELEQGDPYFNPNLSYEYDDFRPDPQKYLL